MSYFAAILAPAADGWVGQELDFSEIEDLDGLADALRDAAVEAEAERVLMFLEEDDEYVAIVRIDGDGEPRVFLSDIRVVDTSEIAAMLYEEAAAEAVGLVEDGDEDGEGEDEEEEESLRPEADPAGDADIVADFGTPAPTLLALCAEEGMLPADVISAVCEKAGCLEALEALR